MMPHPESSGRSSFLIFNLLRYFIPFFCVCVWFACFFFLGEGHLEHFSIGFVFLSIVFANNRDLNCIFTAHITANYPSARLGMFCVTLVDMRHPRVHRAIKMS